MQDPAKKRKELSKPVNTANDEIPDGAPREGTQAYTFYCYAKAYALGVSRHTGRPSTPPVVAGPTCTLVQTMRAHCRDADGKLLKGAAVLQWLEDVVADFRAHADEREYGRGSQAWQPSAFARWLDAGRPKANAVAQSSSAHNAARRAHITVKRA